MKRFVEGEHSTTGDTPVTH